MRWVIEYTPEGNDIWQHAYCDTEQEAYEGAAYLESVGANVTAVYELDY